MITSEIRLIIIIQRSSFWGKQYSKEQYTYFFEKKKVFNLGIQTGTNNTKRIFSTHYRACFMLISEIIFEKNSQESIQI